jgi:hypothetical protein
MTNHPLVTASRQARRSTTTQDADGERFAPQKQKTRHIQISFRIVIDDVDRSAIEERDAIVRQMARDITALKRSRIRYDRRDLFDFGWEWPTIQEYSRAAASEANHSGLSANE